MTAPTQLVDAFAHAAPSPNITNPIPENQGTPGSGTASFDLGFPPETMENPAAGGIPPFGQDMNGILFMISSILAFLNKGNTFQYSSGFAASIGGYAAGAIVQSARTDAVGTGYWLNVIANNMTDPDNPASPNTSGWVPISNYGYTTVDASTAVGGVITLTAQQAARSAVILTGTLTGNLAIVFPIWLDSWLVINSATVGAFAVTARTASGSGVAIPPGGLAQPSGVYGDGTNLYSSITPLSVAVSIAPTPSTIVERNNTGQVLATYFNQDSSLETPAVGAVFVENTAADGFLRKISLAGFNAAAGFTSGSSGVGHWVKYPDGHIEQWGVTAPAGNTPAVTYPLAFPSACESITIGIIGANSTYSTSQPSASRTGFTMICGASGTQFSWHALGR